MKKLTKEEIVKLQQEGVSLAYCWGLYKGTNTQDIMIAFDDGVYIMSVEEYRQHEEDIFNKWAASRDQRKEKLL